MSKETLEVGGIVAAIVATLAIGAAYRRRMERRLAAQEVIVVLVMSEWKSILIVLLGTAVFVLGGVFGWPLTTSFVIRVSVPFVAGCLCVATLLWLTRGWRRVGELRYTPNELSLVVDGCSYALDLRQPFELFEWSESGPGDSTLQKVVLRQGEAAWGFTYPLGVGHKQYDNCPGMGGPRVMLNGEASVIHERLRAWRPSGGRAWL